MMEVGDQAVQDLGMEGRWDKMEEWLKGLTFLSFNSGKDDYDYFHHFAESFVVLLLEQERISEAVSYLALWKQTVQCYSVVRDQLELTVFLLSVDCCQGAMQLLLRIVGRK